MGKEAYSSFQSDLGNDRKMNTKAFNKKQCLAAPLQGWLEDSGYAYLAERLKSNIDETISFNGKTKNCCVAMVDAVGSTKVTAHLSREDTCKYYGIFLNAMALIARECGACVVKNIGDSLLYYFCDGKNPDGRSFTKTLECGMIMLKCSKIVNKRMHDAGLPSVSYRISADFGTVMLAKSVTASSDDIFGPTVNICSKINRMADPNSMIIGNDLYQNVKNIQGYSFEQKSGVSLGFKFDYPVFSIIPKDK